MRKVFVDDVNQNELIQKGYTIVPMLSANEVAYILSEISKLRPNDSFAPNGNGIFNFTYHCSFLDTNVDYKRRTSNLLREVFTPYIRRHLNGYEILNCNFYIKPPHTGEFSIHQNWPALSDINDTTVTVWCPLVDTDKTNGTIEVVDGSHKILPEIAGLGCVPFFSNFKSELIEKYLKPVPLKAGDSIIFDDSLIHWSSQNDSDFPRYAIQILCIPPGATPVYFFYDENNPTNFEVFEVNREFFIENNITNLLSRPTTVKSLGFVENKNRLITEEGFVELLKNGNEIRHKIYFSHQSD